ncbi:MAG TPA: hypothetical protein VK501_10590 [Baekduia sp.]|uniref:hypothetical protein n=1 Tax=Baekduia sp. TaxID=2600305 RepID=UPI002BB657CA|nr:hypothetical protein [Baekduia sp.]HMJ34354.1 hypothetical protein [Baekduia sp.]
MEDPVEVRMRIERMMARLARRDDYGELLARGDVVRRRNEVDSPEGWRKTLRRQARADRIRIRTGSDERFVWALLVDGDTDHRRLETDRYTEVLRAAVPQMIVLRHEPAVVARDGENPCSDVNAARRSVSPMPSLDSWAADSSRMSVRTRKRQPRRRSASCTGRELFGEDLWADDPEPSGRVGALWNPG